MLIFVIFLYLWAVKFQLRFDTRNTHSIDIISSLYLKTLGCQQCRALLNNHHKTIGVFSFVRTVVIFKPVLNNNEGKALIEEKHEAYNFQN